MAKKQTETKQQRNFLRDFVGLSSGTEIPDTFSMWCGLSSISCVLGRRTWIDMGTYTIFPNLFVILVAGSGRCRKSTAISQAEKILQELVPEPNIIGQKITPEALIEALQVEEVHDEKNFMRQSSEGYVIVDELSNFLNKRSYENGLGALLIPLYDCKDSYTYRTRGRGAETLVNLCLGLLGASTIDWIKSALPIDAIGGGLTSRISFIFVDVPPPPVAITTFSEEKKASRERLIQTLSEIQTLQGEFKLDERSWQVYKELYEKFYHESEFYNDDCLSGYASRRHVHLLKIAMILSASENKDLRIEEKHLLGSEQILIQSEVGMPRVVELIKMSDKGALTDSLLRTVQRHQKIERSKLLRLFSHRVDSREFDSLLLTLEHSRQVKILDLGGRILVTM